MPNDQDVAAYIGLDWGDRAHAVQLQPAAGGPVEQLRATASRAARLGRPAPRAVWRPPGWALPSNSGEAP